LQQQLNKQLVIAVLVDMQRLQLLQLDLSAVTVAESVLQTSVSAVISVSTYDRTTDNYISATSLSKSTDYHKQVKHLVRSRLCYSVASVCLLSVCT